MYSQGSKKAGFCYSTIIPFYLALALLFGVIEEKANAQLCNNSAWSINQNIGIHTGGAVGIKPLQIDGNANPGCGDPAIRLSYTANPTSYWGHLVLRTNNNESQWDENIVSPLFQFPYSVISEPGDLVLESSFNAHDLILTTRNFTSAIRFSTTEESMGPDKERMTILSNGNVGIGIANPQSKFAVDGMICAKEVLVSLSGYPCWPDDVFHKDYKLLSLEDLEKEIINQGHLPNVPSSEEVEKTGFQVGEMQATLLRKVEELTLYMIQLKKENEELKNRINQLENKN